MNNEDFERKVEFILNQQAQFAADMQRLEESQAQAGAEMAQLTQNVAQLTDNVAQLTDNLGNLTDNLGNLVTLTLDGFKVTVGGFTDVNAKIDALVDSQILTDEKLRNLIAVVDRHISGGHNGVQN